MKNKTKGILCILAPFAVLFGWFLINDWRSALTVIAGCVGAFIVAASILYGVVLLYKPDGKAK